MSPQNQLFDFEGENKEINGELEIVVVQTLPKLVPTTRNPSDVEGVGT